MDLISEAELKRRLGSNLRDTNRVVQAGDFRLLTRTRFNLYKFFREECGMSLSRRDIWHVATVTRQVPNSGEIRNYFLTQTGQRGDYNLSRVIDTPPFLLQIDDDKEWADLSDWCEAAGLTIDGKGQDYRFLDPKA